MGRDAEVKTDGRGYTTYIIEVRLGRRGNRKGCYMGKTEGREYTVQVEGRGIVIVRDAVGKGVYEKGGYRFQRSTPPPPRTPLHT